MYSKDLIKSSYDMKYYIRNAIIFGALCLIFSSVLYFKIGVILYFSLPFGMSFVLYYICRALLLLRKTEGYSLYSAELLEVHYTWNRNVYLVLSVDLGEEKKVRAVTRGVYSSRLFSSLYYGDLYGKELCVIFNEETKDVMVLRSWSA